MKILLRDEIVIIRTRRRASAHHEITAHKNNDYQAQGQQKYWKCIY